MIFLGGFARNPTYRHSPKICGNILTSLPACARLKLMDESAFIAVGSILECIEAAIFAARVQTRNRVSLLLIASPESAKTQMLLYFRETPTLRYFSSITSKPLLQLRNDLESGRITHLVLQDLIASMSHQQTTAERLMHWLALLMDEGATSFADAGGIVEFRGLPKLGVLAATTPMVWWDKRTRWHRTGLISRFLPIHFDYRDITVDLIHECIQAGVELPDPKAAKLPEHPVNVVIEEAEAEQIKIRAKTLAAKFETRGFRFHKSLRLLAQGRALVQGRERVTMADVSKLDEWLKFMDPNDPAQV
jgi:hypothetical protein